MDAIIAKIRDKREAEWPGQGDRDDGPERGNRGRRMKNEFMQYAAAKPGFVGLHALIGAGGYRY